MTDKRILRARKSARHRSKDTSKSAITRTKNPASSSEYPSLRCLVLTVTSEENLLQIFGDVFKICYDYKVEKVKLNFSKLKIIITIENGNFYEVPFIEFNNENSSMNVSNSIMGKDYAVKFIKDCYNNFKY